ncbi:hypothetical protein AB7M22_000092 [Pseudomonas sp. ADAK2 TE3594]
MMRNLQMLDYLLAQKNFVTLKEYVDFLNELPETLAEIKHLSDNIARSGHTMLPPPNAEALIETAMVNATHWRTITADVPVLGNVTAQTFEETYGFTQEFRQRTAGVSPKSPVSELDATQFSVVKSRDWYLPPPADVIDVMRELWSRLERCKSGVSRFKEIVRSVGETIHSIFVRFIESIGLPLCQCHDPIPKIEAYYSQGRIGLPGMQFDPSRPYSQQERLGMAREHLARLSELYRRTTGAVNNLSDFCYRLTYILGEAQRDLQTNHPGQTVARANSSLRLVDFSLAEVKAMSDQLLQTMNAVK